MPRLLDLYSCQGGASQGYADAGYEVFGVDIEPQPHYPFAFHREDAIWLLTRMLLGDDVVFTRRSALTKPISERLSLADFDAIHTSPPCQLYSKTHRINRSKFPDLIGPTRELLVQTGLPWVIENVMDAEPELRDPVMLCGETFGLQTYRHRLFETNWGLTAPPHAEHVARNTKMGRPPVDGEYMHIVGNFSGVPRARGIMRMPWATRDGLREAIPPAYAEYVGRQMLAQALSTHSSVSEPSE